MNWTKAEINPPRYRTVLLATVDGDYTVGHWSGKDWIGFAGNQSPPFYIIEPGLVAYWAEIEPPDKEARKREKTE